LPYIGSKSWKPFTSNEFLAKPNLAVVDSCPRDEMVADFLVEELLMQ